MTKYINEETLRKLMYEEAFEKDSNMQKWDSGCWIRYKLFENCLEEIPAADVVEVVRCKDCKHRFNYGICAYRGDNWFCGYGERRANN